MKKLTKQIVTIMVAMFAAGQCFAPIEAKPGDQNFHGELSQQELSRLQGGGVANSNGGGESIPEGEVPGTQNDPNAAGVLAGAAGQTSSSASNSDPALLSLQRAGKDARAPLPKPGMNMMLAGFLVMIGLACAYGVRTYLGKVVPNSPV